MSQKLYLNRFQRIAKLIFLECRSQETVDDETGAKALKIIELIEDDDDVQNVFHNMEMTDEIIEKMDG